MDKKIMLLCDESEAEELQMYNVYVGRNWRDACIADGEAEIARIKRELAEEIFAELDDSFDASFTNQRFITDDNYQQLKAKYGTGEK